MRLTRLLPLGLAALLAACASLPDNTARSPVQLYTLGENQELLRLDAAAPQTLLARQALTGLQQDGQPVGLGLRPANGQLYALASSGQLYQLDPQSGAAQKVGSGHPPPGTATVGGRNGIAGVLFFGERFGVDVDPVSDRLRVTADRGMNLRMDLDTSLVVGGGSADNRRQPDTALQYAADDANAGKTPAVVAVAYARDRADPQRSTAYAIDAELGTLVLLGSRAGSQPVVSPDTGTLRTIGPLGLGRLRDASLAIDPQSQRAYAAIRSFADLRTQLFSVDLQTGRTRALGFIGQGRPVQGLVVAP
ncbi:MAG TPA: DUF4394 domain-containing protein [Pseudorhodoferax sp.]|nr:DUF4394 domain-containing protein [Pseudorhodoferax sp.]